MANDIISVVRARRTVRISTRVALMFLVILVAAAWPALHQVLLQMIENDLPAYAIGLNFIGSFMLLYMIGLALGLLYAWFTGRALRRLSDFHIADTAPR